MTTTASWQYFASADPSALSAQLSAWRTTHPGAGVLVFVAEGSQGSVAVLQAAARGAGVPMVGAVFPELVVEGAFKREGLLLLRLDEMPAHRLVQGFKGDQDEQVAALRVLASLADGHASDSKRATLLMFFDAQIGNIASLIDALYAEIGDLPHYAGANAGSETFQPMPCLFDGERLLSDACLALWLPEHPGAVLEHNYVLPEQMLTATASVGNQISQIEWQPAFERYQAFIREAYGIDITRENFYQHAVHLPFALMRADGEVLVRIPVALGEGGELYCVGEVPDNSLLTIVKAVEPGSPVTVQAIRASLAHCAPCTPLVFYCAGRRMHLGVEQAGQELHALDAALTPKHLMGALSLGEIGSARDSGYPLFQNATIVALPWALKD